MCNAIVLLRFCQGAPASRNSVVCFIGGRFGYFLFFCSGRKGGAGRWGGRFLIANPRGGGSPEGGGAEGPAGCLWRIGEWGGGLNIFFFGAEMSIK